MMTLDEIYITARQMSPAEQLRLAALLLQGVAGMFSPQTNEDWTEEDTRDLAAKSLLYAAKLYEDEEDLLPLPINEIQEKANG